MRILVAEDDTALASFVKKGLEAEHYAVDVSADGEQARAMAGELDFDLVVLDLNLPRTQSCVSCAPMIGRTVVTRIKDRRAQARRALIGPKVIRPTEAKIITIRWTTIRWTVRLSQTLSLERSQRKYFGELRRLLPARPHQRMASANSAIRAGKIPVGSQHFWDSRR